MIRKKISSGKRTLSQRGRKTALQMLVACGFLVGAGMMQSCEKDILTGQPEWLGNSIYESLQQGIDVKDGSHKTFNYTIKLIDDLTAAEPDYDYVNILSSTGSRTLFVVPDEVYDEYFAQNGTSYEGLTVAQKKQLFNSSMIKNAYVLELLSNTEGPEEGKCMRRTTAVTINDNIPIMQVADFPCNEELSSDKVNKIWSLLRAAGQPIYAYKDATTTPMMHFLPKFMEKNNITSEDLSVISNGVSNSIDDSWINGKKIISEGQTCKNGYIYVVDGVFNENLSMAEIIHKNTSEMSIWSKWLNRWAMPVAVTSNSVKTRAYASHDLNVTYYLGACDLMYANKSENSPVNDYVVSKGDTVSFSDTQLLKFDPGWNQYTASGNAMAEDAGAMFVPCDSAVNAWFNNGDGQAFKTAFGSLNKIPLSILAPMINVNMMESFVSSVPSKFATSVFNDAGDLMDISTKDIKRCYMGCNGVVYELNRLIPPAEYNSVLGPALMNSEKKGTGDANDYGTFSTIYQAMKASYRPYKVTIKDKLNYDFSPYLLAMKSRLSLVIPYNNQSLYAPTVESDNNKHCFKYIDPCWYTITGSTANPLVNTRMYEFYYDNDEKDGKVPQEIKAYCYKVTLDKDGKLTGTPKIDNTCLNGPIRISEGGTEIGKSVIVNRLNDLINNSIIVKDISGGQEYYKTKAGSVMRFSGMNIQGGFQLNNGEVVTITNDDIYNEQNNGVKNGTTYGVNSGLDGAPTINLPLTTYKTVYQNLNADTDSKTFYNLIYGDLCASAYSKGGYQSNTNISTGAKTTLFTRELKAGETTTYYACGGTSGKSLNYNLSIFDNYNYTIYVPTDAALTGVVGTSAYIPTWDDFKKEKNDTAKEWIANRIHNFVRYHIQDNSVYVNGETIVNGDYESSVMNNTNGQFYQVRVNASGSELNVKGLANDAAISVSGKCNIPARESFIDCGTGNTQASSGNCLIKASSYAIIHHINSCLYYSQAQKNPWKTELASYMAEKRAATSTASSSKRSHFVK